jgi:hypothetical protein
MQKLHSYTDEKLINIFCKSKKKDYKDLVFQLLIERHKDEKGKNKKSWKIRIHSAAFSFLKKCPFLLIDYDVDIIYNRVLMNLFQTLDSQKYDYTSPFKPYFNSLIFKTLLNIRRNHNLKKKKFFDFDNNCMYESTPSLDEWIFDDFTLGDIVSSNYNLEEQVEKQEVVDTFIEKCRLNLSDIAFSILFDNGITQTLTTLQLAKRFKCTSTKITAIKKNEIAPVLDKIKQEILDEFETTRSLN